MIAAGSDRRLYSSMGMERLKIRAILCLGEHGIPPTPSELPGRKMTGASIAGASIAGAIKLLDSRRSTGERYTRCARASSGRGLPTAHRALRRQRPAADHRPRAREVGPCGAGPGTPHVPATAGRVRRPSRSPCAAGAGHVGPPGGTADPAVKAPYLRFFTGRCQSSRVL